MSWDDFLTRFHDKYVPQIEIERLTREFFHEEVHGVGDRDHEDLHGEGPYLS